jgi:group II intron reverse transcriptase/maturase
MSLFDENLEVNLQKLAQELKSETFESYPVRRVYIPKNNVKVRPLGIPSIRDRIVQEALRMILEPIYEADFSQYSFGFRPNRCTMDAVKYAAFNAIDTRKYYWIIEGDISSYFDTINHRKLIKIIRRRIRDKRLLRLIWKFLRAGVMEGKLFTDTRLGTPQGGIVSPLLANIYLNEMDKYMERHTNFSKHEKRKRRLQGQANFIHIRYADDFIVMCNGTRAQAEAMKEELSQFLSTELKLKLSKEKTKITHINDGFTFLGFEIKRCPGYKGMTTKILIPEKAVNSVIEKIKHATSPETHRDSTNSKILALNSIIAGWCRYYQHTSKANATFRIVGKTVYRRMAHWLGRKFRMSIPQAIRRYGKYNTFATAQYRLGIPQEFHTKIYRAPITKPNPYTTQEASITREELPQEAYWSGYEDKPGMTDLRPLVLERDGYIPVTAETAEVDHIKPFRRFKRPVDANRLENLWTLCLKCHQEKTERDRQMESRMQ